MSWLAQDFAFADFVLAPLLRVEAGADAPRAAGLSKRQAQGQFPARLARYAITYAWLERLREELGRELRVAEIGTGTGQMKRLADFLAERNPSMGRLAALWDGFDVAPKSAELFRLGYRRVEQFDADGEWNADFSDCDVVLLLHVLEHLRAPERFAQRLAQRCRSGTRIVIGVPSVPDWLAGIRERQLRKKYLPGGHWCQFSPGRVRRLLEGAGWHMEEITGGFVLRLSGSAMERECRWMRWNLALAHALPSWPGEVYCLARAG